MSVSVYAHKFLSACQSMGRVRILSVCGSYPEFVNGSVHGAQDLLQGYLAHKNPPPHWTTIGP